MLVAFLLEALKGGSGMRMNDVTCHECGAGFQRLELISEPGTTGEYRCPACKQTLESFDGSKFIAYRLTVHPLDN
jgi:hypothetical protein